MEKYNRLWRSFFLIGMIAISLQQLYNGDFVPVIIPLWPAWLPGKLVCMYIFSGSLIVINVSVIIGKKSLLLATAMGYIILVLIVLFDIPFTLNNYPAHLGSWTNPLKALAIGGGYFIIAGSLNEEISMHSIWYKILPAGRFLFAIMITAFGIDHFLYIDFVKDLVPNWIPAHVLWTYFAGIALISSGLGIILNIKLRLAAGLLGLMIFIWFIILHIPRAIADPISGTGNEITSVFEALAFSGAAFLLAGARQKQK